VRLTLPIPTNPWEKKLVDTAMVHCAPAVVVLIGTFSGGASSWSLHRLLYPYGLMLVVYTVSDALSNLIYVGIWGLPFNETGIMKVENCICSCARISLHIQSMHSVWTNTPPVLKYESSLN
jgi:hypothetical protein